MRVFLSFFQTRPAELPSKYERMVAASVVFLNTVACISRKSARRKDFKNRSVEERIQNGTFIERNDFVNAMRYAKNQADILIKEGLRYLQRRPSKTFWDGYLQKFLGFLQYSLGIFTNGQVRINEWTFIF